MKKIEGLPAPATSVRQMPYGLDTPALLARNWGL